MFLWGAMDFNSKMGKNLSGEENITPRLTWDH
jgi:hypothetical protein